MSELFTGNVSSAAKRQARSEKEQSEKKKIRKRAIIVVLIVAVLFGTALFFNSNFARRTLTAVRVGEFTFSATEFDFFFQTTILDYRSIGQQQGLLLPNFEIPLAGQINFTTGQYWTEYFADRTFERMAEVALFNRHADIYGFELSAEDLALIENELEELRDWAEGPWSPYRSFAEFLRFNYSLSMNERVFENMMRFVYRAQAFGEHMMEAFTYSPQELEAIYNERRDDFDLFVFRHFTVHPEEFDMFDFDPDDFELALQLQEMAAEDAAALAWEIVFAIQTLDDFLAFAREHADPWNFEHHDDDTIAELLGQQLPLEFQAWFLDGTRRYGDVTVIEFAGSSMVVYFVERNDNSYLMREMRQILIDRNHFIDFNIEDQTMAHAFADAQAALAAQEVLELFIAGGATEEVLISLMPEHSHDTTVGGLYTRIAKTSTGHGEMQLVPEISRWLFDQHRRVGDFELIRSEAFGHHLVFVSGFGERYRDFLAGTVLRDRDIELWRDSLETLQVTRHWPMVFALG